METRDAAQARLRIRRLRVSNYRSIDDDVRVEFGDLTALVGPNGSGKSNVLDVFRFLSEAMSFGLEPAISKRLGINRLRRAAPYKPRSLKVGIDFYSTTGEASYDIQISAATRGTYRVESEVLKSQDWSRGSTVLLDVRAGRVRVAPSGLAPSGTEDELTLPSLASEPAIRPIIEAMRAMRVHNVYPPELSRPQPIGAIAPLNEEGSNWCSVLKTLPNVATAQLRLALEKITGDISDIRVESSGGFYTAEFEHLLPGGSTRWFSAAQESDGTLRLAGILTALLQTPLPPMLGIEEPELTINPGLLPLLNDYLRAASRDAQIVVTTHSPDLLDLMELDEIRVVQRVAGATRVGSIAEHQRDAVRESLLSIGGLLRSGGLQLEGEVPNLFDSLNEEPA